MGALKYFFKALRHEMYWYGVRRAIRRYEKKGKYGK